MTKNEFEKYKILIIGKTPPPIGGVTIHIKRLLNTLDKAAVRYSFYDYGKEPCINGLKKIFNANIIHLNLSNKNIRLSIILFLLVLHKKSIITFHGKYQFNDIRDYFSLRLSTYSFILNKFTYNNAIGKVKDEKIKLISAFIPPIDEEGYLRNEIREKIDKTSLNKEKIICTNAPGYVIDINNRDLYGIDFLLGMIKKMPFYLLIISDPSGKLKSQYNYECENVLFISEPHSFIEILKRSDIFVRATTADGDSLSVKEALFLGKKVVVSDCVDRPDGCVIYRTDDEESFKNALLQHEGERCFDVQDGSKQIIETYNRLCTRGSIPNVNA
ncbi:hypothetical protein FACS1894147_05250 [Spirochaetia bacterium]|nr:hypothetical protein FACS1894147_05250 [Spirochaetia bacterium]